MISAGIRPRSVVSSRCSLAHLVYEPPACSAGPGRRALDAEQEPLPVRWTLSNKDTVAAACAGVFTWHPEGSLAYALMGEELLLARKRRRKACDR
jgi:hypothetical protein